MFAVRILTSFIFAVGLGLVGVIVWIIAAKSMERELIGMGLLVAVLTGIGARRGASGRVGVLSGIMAVVAMFFTFGIGLAVPSSSDRLDRLSRVDQQLRGSMPRYSETVLMAYITQGVADEWEAQGRTLEWPPQSQSGVLRFQQNQYPKAAWDEAVLRFESLDEASQREINKLWAIEHEQRLRAHEAEWRHIERDDSARRSSPGVRQAVAISSLVLAGLVGGVRTGASGGGEGGRGGSSKRSRAGR